MKMKRTPTIATAALAISTAFGISRLDQPVEATIVRQPSSVLLIGSSPDSTPTPCPGPAPACYSIAPSKTDGIDSSTDCENRLTLAIGCEDRWPKDPGRDANNNEHFLYLPPVLNTNTSKLLVLLGGNDGNAEGISQIVGPVAAGQGYHVIGLTYPAAPANSCGNDLNCYGDAFREVVTGEENPNSIKTTVGAHPQDSIVNRLLKVLQWAAAEHAGDGWGQYLTTAGKVDWTKVHLAGMSNGSSHVSFMGSLEEFQDIGRVALFAGPDDGGGGTTEQTWDPATYIQLSEGTGTRYYGLVHELNKAPNPDHSLLYKIEKNWVSFGMEFPPNAGRFFFDPTPGKTPDFGAAHMLISTDPDTDYREAHESVAHDRYCKEFGPKHEEDPDSREECKVWGDEVIGYEPAWRCILGTGDSYASAIPIANAGADQIVECQGGGGASVILDGTLSKDFDCEVLSYTWTDPFGQASGPRPTRFFPLGTSLVGLTIFDGWWTSPLDTTLVTVRDTQPPSIQVTLTPTLLWPADHRMVRIDATVTANDSCGDVPPQVVLTSITSDQPDNGDGDGDTDNDIQGATFGTTDLSFLLRAERAGGDSRGRTYSITYTAIDASGNCTQASATVHVPKS